MDTSAFTATARGPFLWLARFTGLAGLLKSSRIRSLPGQTLAKLADGFRLPDDSIGQPINHVSLPTPDGNTVIDYIIVSRYGIFVVKTRHMKGLISGEANQPRWTQTINGETRGLPNPLRQNEQNVMAVEALLQVSPAIIHPVVVFTGGSRFASPMPANVTEGTGYVRYIRSFREPVLSEAQVQRLVFRIHCGRLPPFRRPRKGMPGRQAGK